MCIHVVFCCGVGFFVVVFVCLDFGFVCFWFFWGGVCCCFLCFVCLFFTNEEMEM